MCSDDGKAERNHGYINGSVVLGVVTTEVVVAVEVAKVVVEESADDLRTESCFSFSHTLFSTHARTLSLYAGP